MKAINDEGESEPLEGDKPIIAKHAFRKDNTNFFYKDISHEEI